MANHPSAEKRNRQRLVRAARNRSSLRALRTAMKQAHEALSAGEPKAAREKVQFASLVLVKAAGKGVIRLETASRKTSRIQKALHKLDSA